MLGLLCDVNPERYSKKLVSKPSNYGNSEFNSGLSFLAVAVAEQHSRSD